MTPDRAEGLLRALILDDTARDQGDAELLRRFDRHNDQTAFAELVRRHGPMVLGVCRRVARSDADDAFQAAFLVLARKANTIRRPDLLANWLYGVAYRVARRARRTSARRQAHERTVPQLPERSIPPANDWNDLAPILDRELMALPEWYRLPIVMCDLEGLSRNEAARCLGIAEGTLSSRLANGRRKLGARLARRGIGVSSVALLAFQEARGVVVPDLLLRTAGLIANRRGGEVPAAISMMANEGPNMSRFTLFGTTLAVVASIALTMAIAGSKEQSPPGPMKPTPEAKEQPSPKAVATGYEKPRMRLAIDLLDRPRGLLWGASKSTPYIFVEERSASTTAPGADPRGRPTVSTSSGRSSIHIYRADSEASVMNYLMPTGHRLHYVHPELERLATVRNDSRGINAIHEMIVWAPRFKFSETRHGFGPSPAPGPLGRDENTLEAIARLSFLEDTGNSYAILPDLSAVWTTYFEKDDEDKTTHVGLRKLRLLQAEKQGKGPIDTGEVLVTHAAVPGSFERVVFNLAGDQAIMVAKDRLLRAYQLSTGKEMWKFPLSPDEQVIGIVPSANGESLVLATSPDTYGTIGRPIAKTEKDPTEKLKVPATIRSIQATTGKASEKYRTKPYESIDSITVHGSLVAINGTTVILARDADRPRAPGFGEMGPSRLSSSSFVQIVDLDAGVVVQRWKGSALLGFSPKSSPITLGVAEAASTFEEASSTNRLGLWELREK